MAPLAHEFRGDTKTIENPKDSRSSQHHLHKAMRHRPVVPLKNSSTPSGSGKATCCLFLDEKSHRTRAEPGRKQDPVSQVEDNPSRSGRPPSGPRHSPGHQGGVKDPRIHSLSFRSSPHPHPNSGVKQAKSGVQPVESWDLDGFGVLFALPMWRRAKGGPPPAV